MLSHSRCLTRNFGRSLSAIRQGNNVLARRATSGLSACHPITLNNSVSYNPRSSVFQIQYFRTSVAYRDEVVTVKTPAFAESVTEGDVRWEKAVGDAVAEDEVVCEIETDKTSVQVPSPAAGVIEELLVPDGGKVEGGTPLFRLKKGAGASKAPEAPKAEAPAASAPPPPSAAPTPPPPSSVEPIPTIMPTVPPVPAHAMDTKPVSAIKPTAAPAVPAAHAEGGSKAARTESRVKMNRMRLRIAQRLKEAQNTCAMLTTFNEVDMSYSGFSVYPNWIDIDGLEEDFPVQRSSGAEGTGRNRRREHLWRPAETCALSGRAASTDMSFYDSPIRFTGSRK
ncbi:hypothetical protein CHARACLAT_019055 [Characodon lateralis]|uniref:Lipoyl-binding domain-containing protein n=1 Tax=Characodon lateralis TaxID=208331 RepID=A0ABU7CSH4_9TELE|nr:hypothetical protein [Characodon lateralis]